MGLSGNRIPQNCSFNSYFADKIAILRYPPFPEPDGHMEILMGCLYNYMWVNQPFDGDMTGYISMNFNVCRYISYYEGATKKTEYGINNGKWKMTWDNICAKKWIWENATIIRKLGYHIQGKWEIM